MRKTAYKHDVGSYTRNDGKRVEKYKRGKGSKPESKNSKLNTKRQKISNPRTTKNSTFNTSLILSKGSESYLVSGESFSDASRNGLRNLKAAEVPVRVKVRII